MSNMEKVIEDAKNQAEKRLQEKIEKAKNSPIDLTELFTPEEIDVIHQRNEMFRGKFADFPAIQKYEKLHDSALWMDQNSTYIIGLSFEPPNRKKKHAIIALDLKRLCFIQGETMDVLSTMFALSDSVTFSALKDDCIRVTFGIEDIWQT